MTRCSARAASGAALPPGSGSGSLALTVPSPGAPWSGDRGHPAVELDELSTAGSSHDGKPPQDEPTPRLSGSPLCRFALTRPLPEAEAPFGQPLPHGRSRSALTVSHRHDGLLQDRVADMLQPATSRGSPRRQLIHRSRPTQHRSAYPSSLYSPHWRRSARRPRSLRPRSRGCPRQRQDAAR